MAVHPDDGSQRLRLDAGARHIVEVEPPHAAAQDQAQPRHVDEVGCAAPLGDLAQHLHEALAEHDDGEDAVALGHVEDIGRVAEGGRARLARERDRGVDDQGDGPDQVHQVGGVTQREHRGQSPEGRAQREPDGVLPRHLSRALLVHPGTTVHGHQHEPNQQVAGGELQGVAGVDLFDADGHAADAEHLDEDEGPVTGIVAVEPVCVEGEAGPGGPERQEERSEAEGALDADVGGQVVAELDEGRDVDEVVEELEPARLLLDVGVRDVQARWLQPTVDDIHDAPRSGAGAVPGDVAQRPRCAARAIGPRPSRRSKR